MLNNYIKRSIFALALFAVTPSSAETFEGTIAYKLTGGKKDQTSQMIYFIKSPHIRVEMGMAPRSMVSIMNTKTEEGFMLMTEQKMAMSLNTKKINAESKKRQATKDVTIIKTGRSKKILGYQAEEWVSKGKNWEAEMWLAKKMGVYLVPPSFKESGFDDAAITEAAKKGSFPLEIINKDLKGNETGRMTATKIEPQKLNASLFEVPKGFQVMNMGAFDDMMKGPVNR